MSRDEAIGVAWGIGALVLVGSALFGRQLPWRRSVTMAAAWVLIIVLLVVIADNRDTMRAFADRTVAGFDPARGVTDGETLRVKRASDGHFHVRALVNGTPVRFLVDTGATRTGVSAATMAAAGLKPDAMFGDATVETANGEMAVKRVTVATLVIGTIERDNIGVFTPADPNNDDDMDLLGMDVLSSLKSWRVEGDWLILQP